MSAALSAALLTAIFLTPVSIAVVVAFDDELLDALWGWRAISVDRSDRKGDATAESTCVLLPFPIERAQR